MSKRSFEIKNDVSISLFKRRLCAGCAGFTILKNCQDFFIDFERKKFWREEALAELDLFKNSQNPPNLNLFRTHQK